MKSMSLLSLALVASFLSPSFADEKHHSHASLAGPLGGRLLSHFSVKSELDLTPQKQLRVRFLDATNQAIVFSPEKLTATGGHRQSPTQFTFKAVGTDWISEQSLPEGQRLPLILQLKLKDQAKPQLEKFVLDLTICSDCKHEEFRCSCTHEHHH